jgi:hypothetical protein
MSDEHFFRTMGEFYITAKELGSAEEPLEVSSAPFWGYDVYREGAPFLTARITDSVSDEISPIVPRARIDVSYASSTDCNLPNIFSVSEGTTYHGVSRQTIDQLVLDQLTHIIQSQTNSREFSLMDP